MGTWTYTTNQLVPHHDAVKSGGVDIRARVSTLQDPAVEEMLRRLKGLPGIVKVTQKMGDYGPILLVTMKDITFDRMDAVVDAKWDVLDRYPQNVFDIEILDASAQ